METTSLILCLVCYALMCGVSLESTMRQHNDETSMNQTGEIIAKRKEAYKYYNRLEDPYYSRDETIGKYW